MGKSLGEYGDNKGRVEAQNGTPGCGDIRLERNATGREMHHAKL